MTSSHQSLTKCRYGLITIPIATLFGLAAYSSARTPLYDLVPWIPMALCLFLMVTAYSLPYFLPRFGITPTDRAMHNQIALEDGLRYLDEDLEVEPGSIQAMESLPEQEESPMLARFDEHEISNMSRSESRLSRFTSHSDSDIDLEDNMQTANVSLHRMVSSSREGYCMSGLPQTSSDSGYPSSRFGTFPAGQIHQSRNDRSILLSPKSLGFHGPSSESAGCQNEFFG